MTRISTHRGAKTARNPRYLEMARQLREAIEAETYPIGSQLPTEAELSLQFAVSRFTARSALSYLQERGYLSRKPKVGTVVIAKANRLKYNVSGGSIPDLLRFIDATLVRPSQTEDVLSDSVLCNDLQCGEKEPWIRVSAYRISSKTKLPISWTEYYLRPEFRSVVPKIGLKPGPVYALIEKAHGESITQIAQDIGACLLPKAMADILDAPAGSPALRVLHRFCGEDNRTLYAVISVYPGDRFRYVQKLRREL
ncbi:MAG: GntR family transcriptional regulator [Proteobacteria bacterium]|nr:GntR family transcriptional regulator [Pseudomonadota bacterium]